MNHVTLNYGQISQTDAMMQRHSLQSDSAEVLADIYQEDINITTWQRSLSPELAAAAQQILASDYTFKLSTPVTPNNTFESLYDALGANDCARLISDDVKEIVTMFCCLFDLLL